jgi:P27 family predicted phage terminase small subunit
MPNIHKSPEQNELLEQTDRRYKRTPPPAKGEPMKPRGLDTVALKHWETYVPRLMELGVAKDIDSPALESLCRWWSIYKASTEAVENIKDYGSTEAKRTVDTMQAAWKNYCELCKQFGMTPQARNAVDVKQSVTADRGEKYKQR